MPGSSLSFGIGQRMLHGKTPGKDRDPFPASIVFRPALSAWHGKDAYSAGVSSGAAVSSAGDSFAEAS